LTDPVLNLSMPNWIVNAIAWYSSDMSWVRFLCSLYLVRQLLLMLHRQCSNQDLLFHVLTIDVLLVRRRQSMKMACWRQVVFLILILLSHFEVLLSRWRWERRKMGSHCRQILGHVRADFIPQSFVSYQVSSNLYHFEDVSGDHQTLRLRMAYLSMTTAGVWFAILSLPRSGAHSAQRLVLCCNEAQVLRDAYG